MLEDNLKFILEKLPSGVRLVAVSKFHPAEVVMEAYRAGQRCFGESRPQEFMAKAQSLPKDIVWHFIGHLQTNKLKMVLPYAAMVESVDSEHLLQAIDKWGVENGKLVDVLLEVHIAQEETKQGFSVEELMPLLEKEWRGVRLRGLMGMATNTDDESVIRSDFKRIQEIKRHINDTFPGLKDFDQLSIGMSGDWPLALDYGATIVRIGTAIFGARQY
ncbi:MAG: YggS family pyridoxal phosphate-dependent enzyme [Bacteroidales bacterium]|nr:YggS family pyridoxal phosphate-dependent enzyme [Bacteroidales bacterium]MBQ2091506.1 YggS family pyridoxal phosphate-dependent enzyme [Bacteroidales bacterium]